MRSGSLRHKIILQVATVTKDKFGANITTWNNYRTVFASIETMKSYEKQALSATFPAADYTITMRFCAGVQGGMRVVGPDGTIYAILGVPNNVDGRNREMILTAQSGIKAS